MTFTKITEQPSLHGDLEHQSVRQLLEGINEEADRAGFDMLLAYLPTAPGMPRATPWNKFAE